MTKIAKRTVPRQPSVAGTGAFHAPVLDAAAVDFYIRRGREERARAFSRMIRSIFSSPADRPGAEVRALPARRRGAEPGACEDCDRAA